LRYFLELKQRKIKKLRSQSKISEDFPLKYLQLSESVNLEIESRFAPYEEKDLTSFDDDMEEAQI